jgi:HlyD family secretion protein
MAKSKKGRKIVIFSVLGLVVAGLVTAAVLKKREVVITVQTEKVARRSLTELVVANGKIQPVVQVKISPEVSGEIIDLPVKEGQPVNKGDLILKIKPDFYIANRNQATASYNSSLAGKDTAEANLVKAEAEFKRAGDLFRNNLISASDFDALKAGYDVARSQVTNATHQVAMSKALLARAEEELAKTTIVSPLTGTVSKLNSQLGERVVGTATMAGTDVMIIADLNEMEARVDIGEVDVVLIKPGQNVRLEVDAFKDQKFTGTVTEIANSSKGSGFGQAASSQQEATKFEVKIRIKEKESFRPGMSVTAEVETRCRSNVLTVPIASVTTRLPQEKKDGKTVAAEKKRATNAESSKVELTAGPTPEPTAIGTNIARGDRKKEGAKPIEVVFIKEGDHVKMVPVKIGISDDSYWEVTEGLQDGQEVVSGGYRAISRDLEDGKKVKIGPPAGQKEKEAERKEETS